MDHVPVPAIYCVGKTISATITVDGKKYTLRFMTVCGKKIVLEGRRK